MQTATSSTASRRKRTTLAGSLIGTLSPLAGGTGEHRWPSQRWATDPVGFARDVLGIELWSAQVKILESIRDHRNTTVRSGHKCGKSTALAVAALWFFCTFDRARVFLTAVKPVQIDEVIWKEIRRLYRGAKIPLGGELYDLARSGLKSDDERQIWGGTARDGEGLAGISGPNILILVDEASGIQDKFFEVLGSSLAGSGGTVRKCYISNPTRTVGEFYRSHTSASSLFSTIHVSSEDTPNARGEKVIPGLAGPEWIAEKRIEYGEDSHAYRVRVKGDFVHDKDGKIISLDDIAAAQLRWDEVPDDGRLQLGLDPAGDGVIGDESAIAARRGARVSTVRAERGKTEDDLVVWAADLATSLRRPREPKPRIVVDAEGGIGTRVVAKLRAWEEAHPDTFDVIAVRSGRKMWGSPEFDTIRDGLWGTAQKFIRGGGAIPEDVKLAQELNAPTFTADKNQRYIATPKKELRKALGRSPDRADAVCLAVWEFELDDDHERDDEVRTEVAVARPLVEEEHEDIIEARTIDPYDALRVWG